MFVFPVAKICVDCLSTVSLFLLVCVCVFRLPPKDEFFFSCAAYNNNNKKKTHMTNIIFERFSLSVIRVVTYLFEVEKRKYMLRVLELLVAIDFTSILYINIFALLFQLGKRKEKDLRRGQCLTGTLPVVSPTYYCQHTHIYIVDVYVQ